MGCLVVTEPDPLAFAAFAASHGGTSGAFCRRRPEKKGGLVRPSRGAPAGAAALPPRIPRAEPPGEGLHPRQDGLG